MQQKQALRAAVALFAVRATSGVGVGLPFFGCCGLVPVNYIAVASSGGVAATA